MIRAIVRAAVRNPVAANLAMIAILACGWVVYAGMPREVFPDFSLDKIEVFTTYPGASPEDVERLITRPLEEAADGVDGVHEVISTSREGVSRITLTLDDGETPGDVLEEVRDAVRRADIDLPEEADEALVTELQTVFPAISVFVYGVATEAELRRLTERHKRRIEGIDGVAAVFTTGVREPRLWIEVDPLALERYDMTLQEVGRVVEAKARDVPLGSLSTAQGDWLLRLDAEVDWAEDLADLPLRALPEGATLRLSQVASLSDTFERDLTRARFNGQPCLHMQVNKTADADMIRVARRVRDYVAEESATMPAGTALGTNADLSIYVSARLRVMAESGAIAAVLVLASLLAFLQVRVALATALGIPIAFLGGIMIAGSFGVTMNMITMFALIVALGMLVDDAIVVGENVFRRMEEGEPPDVAAIEGTAEVGRPVLATILTSIAAFLPILLLQGQAGLFLRPLPLVVTFCLAVSIVEALTILPAHLAHWMPASFSARHATAETQQTGASPAGASPAGTAPTGTAPAERRRWYTPLRDLYLRVLSIAVRWRYVTLAAAISTAAVVGGIGRYWIPFVYFDDFESQLFYVNLRMTPGTSLDETERVTAIVEDVAMQLPAGEIQSVNTLLGVSASDISSYVLAQNVSQVWIELREGEGRTMSSAEVVEELRRRLADLPPIVESFEIDQPQSGPSGRAVELSVRGPELATLTDIATELRAALEGYAGIRDVRDDLEQGKRLVRITLRDSGRTLGFTEAGLAAELRSAFEGTTFGHVRRGTDDVELVVKYPESVRERRGTLGRLRVRAPSGARVPLDSVALLEDGVGPAVIGHDRHERAVTVMADVNKAEGNAATIVADLQSRFGNLEERHPGYSLSFRGDIEDTTKSMDGLRSAIVVSIAIIYLILGTLFRSFAQPIVIMFVIPFAGVGMILGHGLMDRPITMLSLIGLLALMGVVVNDSLILVDFVNARRARGLALFEALMEAGRLRFRPIILTSITTMLGLTPLTFFATGQARFLQPMAISLFFGLALTTFLILVLVPCAYAVLEDTLAWLKRPSETFSRWRRGAALHV